MAQTDFLTNVYNRRYLFNEGATAVAQAHQAGAHPAVVMFDLDHFKNFNDKYGYAIGDKVLKTIASITMEIADADDKLVVRLGGEEFGVFIADGGLEVASALAEQIRAKIANTPLQANGKSIRLSASFGVAQFAPGETIDSVLNVADIYLHEAKESGRNRVVSQPANAVKQSA
jgi:diguanylate cyclase (GGDEF)-like protein